MCPRVASRTSTVALAPFVHVPVRHMPLPQLLAAEHSSLLDDPAAAADQTTAVQLLRHPCTSPWPLAYSCGKTSWHTIDSIDCRACCESTDQVAPEGGGCNAVGLEHRGQPTVMQIQTYLWLTFRILGHHNITRSLYCKPHTPTHKFKKHWLLRHRLNRQRPKCHNTAS